MSFWPSLDIVGRRIGYARVSTADQKLAMQLDALNGVGCDTIFKDHGVSGTQASRPGLDDALSDLREGDALIVFKLDRLGRSVLHLSDLLARFQNEGIHFVSLSEGVNTTTSGGRMIYHLFSTIAEFERDLIRERTVHGLEAAKARGQTLGRPRLLDPQTVLEAHRHVAQKGVGIGEMAERLGVSHSTLARAFKEQFPDQHSFLG